MADEGHHRPDIDGFRRQVAAARVRLDALRHRRREQPLPVLDQALDELLTAHEELRVTEEELRIQNEELAASQLVVAAERARYEELFQHAPDAYLVTDTDGVIVEANAAACALLDVSAGRLSGKPLGVFVPPEERRTFRTRLARAAGAGRVDGWETWLQPRRGAPVAVSCTVTAVRGEAGGPAGLRWIVRDVTERRRAEEGRRALAAEEAARAEAERRRAFLEAVLRHLPGGVMIADAAEGRIVMHNAEAGRILRHPVGPDTLLRGSGGHGMLLPGRAPAPAEAYPLARALRGESVEGEEVPYRRGDGHVAILRCSASPVRGPDGETIAAAVSFADVTTELRAARAERFLAEVGEVLSSSLEPREVLQQVARVCAGSLADYCMVHVEDGEEGLRVVGLAHADPTREELVRGLLRRFPLAGADHPVLRALRTGDPEVMAEVDEAGLDRLCAGPEHRDMVRALGLRSGMAVPIRAHDRTLGVLSLARTEGEPYDAHDLDVARILARRAALAVENARLYERARQAVRARDEVVAVVSHDLRNPLNAVLIASTILTELGDPGRLEPGDRKQLEIIRRAAEQMTALAQDLLEVSALESGSVTMQPRACAPSALVAAACEMFAPEAGEKGITVRPGPADELPPVEADYGRVLQVFGNLVGNAVKFTPAGGEVEVGAARAAEYVRFWVRDTGPGIEREHLPRMFDRFWQARRGRHSGAGLGLSIVRSIVEGHGGQVWAESEPGAGSTFHFTLRVSTDG